MLKGISHLVIPGKGSMRSSGSLSLESFIIITPPIFTYQKKPLVVTTDAIQELKFKEHKRWLHESQESTWLNIY